MKLSKAFWIVLIVVVLGAASVWLFTQYNAAVRDKDAAETGLASALRTRDQLAAEVPGLESELAQAEADILEWQLRIAVMQDGLRQAESGLAQAQSQLPDEINNLDYDETLLAMAHASGLQVVSLETSDRDETELEGNAGFISTTFSISIKGDVPGILDLYNLIVSDPSFRTGRIDSVVIEKPLPMTEEQKAELADGFYTILLTELQSSFTVEERVVMIEEAILELLDEPYEHVTLDQMTERVRQAMASFFGAEVADRLAHDIALALETEVANTLIDTVAGIYGKAAGLLFIEGDPQLTPVFTGILGPEITDMLRTVPVSSVPGIVSDIIATRLNAIIQARIESMVDLAEVERRVNEIVIESEKATANISLTVVAYPGGGNG